ncbi:MAG: DUF1223 domain-containing protein [Pelagimonas sp.]|uniref:DUF1223 domain-containing protein n=1 Tax=Pelagimonas sp. TaxID=2073170 RepID=UPI003D6B86AF
MRKLIPQVIPMTVAAWTAFSGALWAQENPVVVELFTSQGCSSCPPADALLHDLAGRDDVIPLALHVDYWDYIGWKDVFAKAQFTKRQKGYARAGGWRTIYTPQMVINGAEDVVGSRPMKVTDLIRKHSKQAPRVDLNVSRSGGKLLITARALQTGEPCDIHIVRYEPLQDVKITRGENAGRSLTYSHIVKDWQKVARWDGQGTYQSQLPLKGKGPVVVILQEPGHGAIVAAARLR